MTTIVRHTGILYLIDVSKDVAAVYSDPSRSLGSWINMGLDDLLQGSKYRATWFLELSHLAEEIWYRDRWMLYAEIYMKIVHGSIYSSWE